MQAYAEEDEEISLDLDYKSPKGQLIRFVEQKMKKIEIDDSLGKVLDQYNEIIRDQKKYLENGIFRLNFAEDALLLQICGQFYAKRVDKFWKEILELHTSMISYDRNTVRHCTDSNKREARKQEIARLEERLNRRKRKKISLAEAEPDELPPNSTGKEFFLMDYEPEDTLELFDGLKNPFVLKEGQKDIQEAPSVPFKQNDKLLHKWKQFEREIRKKREKHFYSSFIAEYHKLRYRLKPYKTVNSDNIIYDHTEPEEYSVKEGQLISYHPYKQLFEANDNCLCPDEHFTIARLRLAYSLRGKWFRKNNIDQVNAPYETYSEAWEKYQEDFFENESRKIQNMPQKNQKDLLLFYKALVKKEQLALKKVEEMREMGAENIPEVSFRSVIIAPAQEGYTGIFDPYVPEGFDDPIPVIDLDLDESLALSESETREADLSTPSENASTDHSQSQGSEKLRSDSGYFDGGLVSDHEDPFEETNAETVCGNKNEISEDPALPSASENVSGSEMNDSSEVANSLNTVVDESATSPMMEESEISNERREMNNTIREFANQALSDKDLIYKVLKDSFFKQTEDLTTIIYKKPRANEEYEDEYINEGTIIFCGYFNKEDEREAIKREVQRQLIVKLNRLEITENRKKRKLEKSSSEEDTSPKRRRLSKKQIEKLKTSLIKPVKEEKWNSFYSFNYQPECGEGKIDRINYESDIEDLFDDADMDMRDCLNDETRSLNASGYHSGADGPVENDDSCDQPQLLTQDSGIGLNESHEVEEMDQPHNLEGTSTENFFAEFDRMHLNGLKNNVPGEIPIDELDDSREKCSEEIDKEELAARVEEWKEYMTPKLKTVEERDFDIHEYGANIMNSMKVNETKPFDHIVEGKSSAEVVRYFISTLQLANTMNVEICGVTPGELSNDTLALKLLSKERYHECLRDYHAPSEVHLSEKLQKIREIQQQNKNQREQGTKWKLPETQGKNGKSRCNKKQRGNKDNSISVPKSSKKIRTLNYSVMSPANRNSRSNSSITVDFQQPSTSWHIDERQPAVSQAPAETPIDSGHMPRCDEDFLEQFDELQQISGESLQSTPVNSPNTQR